MQIVTYSEFKRVSGKLTLYLLRHHGVGWLLVAIGGYWFLIHLSHLTLLVAAVFYSLLFCYLRGCVFRRGEGRVGHFGPCDSMER